MNLSKSSLSLIPGFPLLQYDNILHLISARFNLLRLVSRPCMLPVRGPPCPPHSPAKVTPGAGHSWTPDPTRTSPGLGSTCSEETLWTQVRPTVAGPEWPTTPWSPISSFPSWHLLCEYEFNSDDHYIYHYGQESLRRNGVTIMVNKRVRNAVLGCNLITTEWSLFVSKANHSISQ